MVQEWLKLGCGDELEKSELCVPDWFDGYRQNFHIQTFCFAPSTTWKKQSQAKLYLIWFSHSKVLTLEDHKRLKRRSSLADVSSSFI